MANKKNNDKVKIAVMAKDVEYIKKSVDKVNARLDSNFVTKAEFDPVKKIVFGLIGLSVTGVILALLRLVLVQ